MSWTTRASMACVLAVAFATAPLVIDQCAASCDLARAANASTSAPTCHHTSSATAHIGHPPKGCGHDHSGVGSTLTVAAPTVLRALSSTLAVVATPASVNLEALGRADSVFASPPLIPTLHRLSVSLRI